MPLCYAKVLECFLLYQAYAFFLVISGAVWPGFIKQDVLSRFMYLRQAANRRNARLVHGVWYQVMKRLHVLFGCMFEPAIMNMWK